ncbi:ABC-type antimicrobial peptide transport system, ATPase component [Gottschalkia purinilytica]|uniref:ABC-type antimicrobial peptide transport system, ATPase component n=1 Tax=Gottschalkia purinilytica TaxID=1503 RepID=A0A0L0WC62_GOTPU|nr:ABC transporter ATP-binding protein [Gottschalkia purinilytica]KNF09058.1 ABC-type antimicrobial peptide transport system, ATPase component [Gottschalkia purinilytica]
MEVCRLENVKKSYEADENVTPIKQVSLSINSGNFLCIEGPSGIGKSTLLYIIGGLLNISSGNVFIDGKNINTMTDKELTDIRRNKIGFIFQDSNLIQALTIEENLIFVQSMVNKKKDYGKVKELLTRLGLWERKNFLPNELSGGQRRRAMVACALIKDPLLILADEPTNDLDEYWANEVINLLSEVVDNGKSVVLVTHNTLWAEKAQLRFDLSNGVLHEKQCL